jgi:mannose-6-phosphate isomerase-like protein (cupin superfamily)
VEGELKIIYGDELIVLATGDSVYLDASLPHALFPGSRGEARVLSVSFEPDRNGGAGRLTRSRVSGKGNAKSAARGKA